MSVVTTVTLSHESVEGASLVGKIVKIKIGNGPETFDETYEVHSVEGPTWYAFAQDGRVTVDDNMILAYWIAEPQATLVPVGCKIGEGFSRTVGVSGLSIVNVPTCDHGTPADSPNGCPTCESE